MYRKILTLVKHTLVYGLGSVGTRLIGFLLIPVYTRFMTPADYGILALCTTTAGMLKIVSQAGIPTALFRSYLQVARTEEERRQVLATGLATLAVIGTVVFALMVVWRTRLAGWIFGDPGQSGFILLIAVANLARIIQAFRNASFRIHDQSRQYTVVTTAGFTLNLVVSIYLVAGLRQGAWGAMTANALAVGAMAIVFVPWSVRRLAGGFSTRVLRDLLKFGLPLVPAGVAVWVMNLSDVYILRFFRDPAEVGIYTLGYKFGLGILILTNAFRFAYPKVVFSEGQNQDSPDLFSRVVTYYAASLGGLCLAVAVFAPQVILIADVRFHDAARVIPLVVAAYFFNGLMSTLEIGMNLRNRTVYLAGIIIGGGLFNVGLNLLFIPRYGMMAAAVTTLATYVLILIPTYMVSSRLYPLRLEWGRLAKITAVFAAAALAATFLPAMPLAGAVAAKAGLCLAIYPALYLLRFFTPEEMSKLRSWRHHAGPASGSGPTAS
ncbi:MAG: flippase [Acidobacteriota bacterium]